MPIHLGDLRNFLLRAKEIFDIRNLPIESFMNSFLDK